MTKVYIIRHAEVIYPLNKQGERLMYPPETHISEEGKRQSENFAQILKRKGIKFDVLETSPYTRARETAEIFAAALGNPPIIPNKNFRDSDVSGWIGIPLREQQILMDNGEDIYDHPKSADQETREQITKRMIDSFNDLVRRNEGKTVAIVSHGDSIALLIYQLEHPEEEIPSMSKLSKEKYLKRGEIYFITLDHEGKILETEILSNLEGQIGEREKY